ncbi:hypothetical protein [uncultured Methanobrevibacter sp.]|uniref:hypothetical protein n=1 Tax=uncultured Methanobrevibacter sp. TaxID=253161 RepID=UPI0025D1E6DD|nr:hypothetical protein [uncultured Methanobrevibacter sp.]
MNGLTILLWITIFIIGVIAIIAVKLHYKGSELEKDETSILPTDKIDDIISYGQNKVFNSNETPEKEFTQSNPENDIFAIEDTYQDDSYIEHSIEEVPQDETYIEPTIEEVYQDEAYIEPTIEDNSYKNIEYESPNQVLINYGNEVEKFQEPMTEKQVEIMTPDNEKHELKDLFTIDELIKESKRKDSEREKESQQINKDDDTELTELKESIRKRKDNEEVEDQLIEEILADEEISELLTNDEKEPETEEPTIQQIIEEKPTEEEPTIQQIIEEKPTEEEPTIQQIIEEKPTEEETVQEVLEVGEEKEETIEEAIVSPIEEETPSVASQKDIAEAIDNASHEIEEKEIESISESENITDALLNSEEEIKEPVLKTPTKIDASKKDEISGFDSNNQIESTEENDLDYRKDLAKITNTIKSSKLFKEVKDKITGEPEPEVDPLADIQESYIRNVNDYDEYDEYAPIINETHDEFGEIYEPEYEPDYDQAIREENTRKLMNNVRTIPEPEVAEPKITPIKSKPSRDNIKIQIGNADIVLKKGDEIIFRHDGETYSSQVYGINGDDISVRYRGKNITIKPEDVKKVY